MGKEISTFIYLQEISLQGNMC